MAPPSHIRPELGARFDGVIARAMARDPARRYAHADELARDLIAAAGTVDTPDRCAAALLPRSRRLA